MPDFVEVNLLRPIPELVTAAGYFSLNSDAAARLLVRLCVGVSEPGADGDPFRPGCDPIRFADPDPAVRRGADRAMHELLRYDHTTALVRAGEVRRALRTALERAGVRELYPVGSNGDRLDLERYELFVDLVSVGNTAALAASDTVDIPSMIGAHQALLEAYSLGEDGFTRGTVIWPHLEVVEGVIIELERRLLAAILLAADAGAGTEPAAAARRAGRRLLALGVGEAQAHEDALVAYLASAVDQGDLQARWRQVEKALPAIPPRLREEKERQGALHDPGRFGAAVFTTRRVCRMREATPWELGVEKAAVETADATGLLPFVSPGSPQRRLEAALADALGTDGVTVIVLRGASGTGKSRMAYEAARSIAAEAWVVAPRNAEFAAAVHDPGEHAVLRARPGESVIVWLDDVELHVGAEIEGAVRPGLTVTHLERLRDAGPDRPLVILATAGGKGYRTYQEAGERAELQRLGLEIDRFIKHADVLIPVSGAVERRSAVAVLGEEAAEEIAESGIGSYALRTEILGALYLRGDWPIHLKAPAGERREGLALADSLLAWRIAVADEAVAPEVARALWLRFRARRDLQGPANEEAWKSAVGWATATAVPHQPLVCTRPDGSFDVNDNLRAVADVASLAEHLLLQEDLPQVVDLEPFEVGLRLHLAAPDVALAFYRRAMESGDPRAPNNIGALVLKERPEDAMVYFRRAVDGGDPRGHLNLARMLESEHPDRARRELRHAVSAGYFEAFVPLAGLIEKDDPEEALLLLREGARRGDLDALVAFAHRIFDQDEDEARSLLREAMERGSPKAALHLGLSYVDENREKALGLLERAGRMGEPAGYLAGANFLPEEEGEDAEERLEARIGLYRAAADAGLVEGMFNAAALLHDRDPDLAEAYYEQAVAAGSAAAMNNLGHRLRDREPRRAEELFRQAIELKGEDSSSAMRNLADLLREDRQDESIALYRQAAEMGNASAMFNLAGVLVDERRDEAIGLLEEAVELGHSDAMVHLGYLLGKSDPDRGLSLMRQAAELGNDNAQNNLGVMLEDDDKEEAEMWFRKAVEGGNLRAKANLGRLLAGTDHRQAIRLWEEAAVEGDPVAAELLAERVVNLEEEGELTDVSDATQILHRAVEILEDDPETARRLMESAAAMGSLTATVNLAVMELDEDSERALELLRMAAEAGDARGMFYLGQRLMDTEPVEAEKLLRAAVARGEPSALVQLGRLVSRHDPDEAISIFREAAVDGDPEAMFDLAALLFEADRASAIEWLRQAAAAGIPAAMHNLGVILFEQKKPEGLEFFERASDAGYASSSMNLGLLLIEANPSEALRYFRRAVEAGSEAAQKYVEEIERSLSSSDGQAG